MYALATAAPLVPRAGVAGEVPSADTLYMAREDSRAWSDRVAARTHDYLPVCLDHAGGEHNTTARFVVPPEKRIGRVVDAMVRGNGNLLTTIDFHYDQPAGHDVFADIMAQKPWGVSLCVNADGYADPAAPGVPDPSRVRSEERRVGKECRL